MKVRELTTQFEQFAPQRLAMAGDPVGLQLGSLDAEVSKVLVTLDVRPEVVDEAIAVGADLIFAHHPAMFRPVKNMDLSVPQNAMYAKIIENHITVYAAHTNLDNADGGMNDWLAETLQLVNPVGLVPEKTEAEYLLTVHVSPVYADAVRLAMVGSGAGNIDRYKGTSYEWNGTSWFTPLSGADPELGPVGERTQTDEVAIQARVSDSHVDATVQAVNDVFPGGHPSLQLIPLRGAAKTFYMGRVGDLATPMTARDFAEYCKAIFGVAGLRLVAADPLKMIHRVAVLGGDGGRFYPDAIAAGADAYVTGDVYYHTGHDMLASGLTVVDPGHHIEQICKPKLTELFEDWQLDHKWPIEIVASKLNTDPFTFV
ncbi:Nif3-like dinuclear metal center hexameric protein [uncultured Secundilactobacillus sp.]|uniref:Nif3-like dinuclear metal center hexameric protein n=1 Tax=uncultured Secundilactobacillus sp. TaxID=2813935 RepID=UPI0025888E75|nr:Nif3-like dinuclear metal center hexameric protein [uncultured Secundilactobacillus sp.]